MLRFALRFLSLSAFAAIGLAGCVPNTPYRNAAMTPAATPIAWDGRMKPAGTLHADGAISTRNVVTNWSPQIHDTASHVPDVTMEANVSLTPVRGLDVGFRGTYAAYRWTSPSALGTMEIPSHPSQWGFGPEIHGAFPLDRSHRVQLGVAGSFLYYDVPYAAWERDQPCDALASCAPTTYHLAREGSEGFFTYNLSLTPSVGFGPESRYGAVFAFVGITTGFSNDGFTDRPSNGSTVQARSVIPYLGGGYSFSYQPLRVAVATYVPFGERGEVMYGFGGYLTIGVDLELWHRAPPAPRPAEP
jgi:hypothetical protein